MLTLNHGIMIIIMSKDSSFADHEVYSELVKELDDVLDECVNKDIYVTCSDQSICIWASKKLKYVAKNVFIFDEHKKEFIQIDEFNNRIINDIP